MKIGAGVCKKKKKRTLELLATETFMQSISSTHEVSMVQICDGVDDLSTGTENSVS